MNTQWHCALAAICASFIVSGCIRQRRWRRQFGLGHTSHGPGLHDQRGLRRADLQRALVLAQLVHGRCELR